MSNEHVPIQPFGSWTAYPSLLPLLTNEQQVLLENAVSAHYCGRYPEADSMFRSPGLPPAHTVSITALQYADMLTASGRERERVIVLRQALGTLNLASAESRPLKILLQLMLAEAEISAHGLVQNVRDVLAQARSVFWTGGVDGLSDIQVRLALTYYQMSDWLKQDTNMYKAVDEMVFEADTADTCFASRREELWAMYRALKAENRWRIAPLLMMFVLQLPQEGPELHEAIMETTSLRETLSAARHPGIQFRSVPLRQALCAHMPPEMANMLRHENIHVLSRLSEPAFDSWQGFCPLVASTMAQLEVTTRATQPEDLISSLAELSAAAERRNDFLRSHQLHRAARDVCKAWLDGIVDGEDSRTAVLERFRRLKEDFVFSQKVQAHSLYNHAYGLADLLATLSSCGDQDTVMVKVDQFAESYPAFAIPRILERIYATACEAALARGQDGKFELYTKQQLEWEAACPMSDESGAFADKSVLDPDHAVRWIFAGDRRGRNMVSWGDNAVRIMLRWAAYEWDECLLSTQQVEDIFSPGLDVMPDCKVSDHLRGTSFAEVAGTLLGTADNPVDSSRFLDTVRKLLKWLQEPDRRPSLGTRLLAVKVFVQSRLRRFGDYLQKTSLERVNSADRKTYEIEREKEAEIDRIQARAEDKFVDSTLTARNAIHTLMVKCFQPRPEAQKAIPEADFEARVKDAQDLCTIFSNRSDLLREYEALTTLTRLYWQFHMVYPHKPPEAVLNPAERAEVVFCKIRDLIISDSPPDNLVARTRMPGNFDYTLHRRLALVGSFFAYKLCQESVATQSSPKAQHFLMEFVGWAVRSKGRGFADISKLDAEIAESLGKDMREQRHFRQQNINPESTSVIEDIPGTGTDSTGPRERGQERDAQTFPPGNSPNGSLSATPGQIAELLSLLPHGVVIVDYIDMLESYEMVKRVAVIYRRDRDPLVAPILPVAVQGQVIGWWHRNIAKNENPLDDPDGIGHLAALSGLVGFIETEEFFVPEGETLIICPTAILHRVPLHAVPVSGRPLIERNPILYCQSLTMLHWLWTKSSRSAINKLEEEPKASVINPMPVNWPRGEESNVDEPVMSIPTNRDLASQLGASYHGGYPLNGTKILQCIQGSSMLHYYGHVHYNSRSALDSVMSLGKNAYQFPFSTDSKPETISARDLFDLHLAAPALVTIIGCSSGVASVSRGDEVLGLQTALFFAGAGAVVSTLWDIQDVDGEAFTVEFYAALESRRNETTEANRPSDNFHASMVDLAAAMRDAVLALRDRAVEHLKSPYHWAAFTLNGFHLFPADQIPKRRSPVLEANCSTPDTTHLPLTLNLHDTPRW